MAKCIKCGGSFLTRGRIRLADADICFKCFDSLGFDHKAGIYDGKSYKWDEIKDGSAAYWRNKKREHEEWLSENPDVADFMDAIDEGHENEENEDDTNIDEDE